MSTPPAPSRLRRRLWRSAPVVLTALLSVAQLVGLLLEDPSVPSDHSMVPALVVFAQAGVLLARHRLPLVVLLVVVALDAVALLDSSGEVTASSFAVAVAVYTYAGATAGRLRYLVPAALAVINTVVMVIALQTSVLVPSAWAVPFALVRAALTFALPIAVAAVVEGRARLLEMLQERADAAERERERQAEQAVLRDRTLLARELHDIAAHHLTGIIVSAQAADALRATDPDGAGQYLRQVQLDARTTLDNLRQTVGLLRGGDVAGELAPVASMDGLSALVEDASSTGSIVQFEQTGTPRELGPLAGIVAYRMVQESLANALTHAPGSARTARIDYEDAAVRLTVSNGPATSAPHPTDAHPTGPRREGYGLLGMTERAELVGATLRTGPTPDGGWVNTLEIPYDGEAA